MRRHTLKFGADLRGYDFRDALTVSASGLFVFVGIFTGGPLSPPGSGATPIADFVLGDITPVPGTSGFQTAQDAHARQYYQGYYVSDIFQLSRKLTINAGLRWEIPGSYTEANDRNTALLPQLQSPLVLVHSPQYPSRHDLESHYRLFAPRVGLAYQLKDHTVIRVGYGINFLPQGVGVAGPWYSPINSAETDVPFGGTLSNPLPNVSLLQPIGRNASAWSTFIGQSIQSRIPGQSFPYMQQWNLNVQHALGDGGLFKIAYAGSRGEHIPLGVPALEIGDVGADLNQLSPAYYSMGSALLQPATNPNVCGVPVCTVGQTLRPYPEYQNVDANSDFAGDTYYNSLQGTFEKRFSYGGAILADYTWAKLISNAEGVSPYFELNTAGAGAIQDYTNLRAERSLAGFDVPHRFVLSYVLELPFGRGKRFLADAGAADKLVSGWSAGEHGAGPNLMAAWVSNDEANHRLAFVQLPDLGEDPDRAHHHRLQHFAFEYRNLDELPGTYARLKEQSIMPVLCTESGAQTAFYYEDPDHNRCCPVTAAFWADKTTDRTY